MPVRTRIVESGIELGQVLQVEADRAAVDQAQEYFKTARRWAPVVTGRFRRSLTLTNPVTLAATVSYARYVIRHHDFWNLVIRRARRIR